MEDPRESPMFGGLRDLLIVSAKVNRGFAVFAGNLEEVKKWDARIADLEGRGPQSPDERRREKARIRFYGGLKQEHGANRAYEVLARDFGVEPDTMRKWVLMLGKTYKKDREWSRYG